MAILPKRCYNIKKILEKVSLRQGGNMGKPFVKLFRVPNAGYCFDLNKNEIFQVEEEPFSYLYNLLSGKEVIAEEPEEVLQLKAEGYLSDESAVKEVKHPMTDYLGNYLDRPLLKLTLQITQDCNFRCKYCVYSEDHNNKQNSHSKKHMDWDTAKKAVDFLREHSMDSSSVNIGFYGGEPLLEMGLIHQVVEYSENLFAEKDLSFSVTTNGTLLTEEIIS